MYWSVVVHLQLELPNRIVGQASMNAVCLCVEGDNTVVQYWLMYLS